MEGPAEAAWEEPATRGRGPTAPSGGGSGGHKVQRAAVGSSVIWARAGPEEAEVLGGGGEYSAPSTPLASRPGMERRPHGQGACGDRPVPSETL